MNAAARPWPVVLLTALGAWLAAVPLIGVVGLLFGDLVKENIGPYLVGALLLAAAVVVLRSRAVPLFVEQLAVPALLVGAGALGFGLFRDLPNAAALGVLSVVATAVAVVVPAAWLRVLLGAAAAVLTALSWLPERWSGRAVVEASWFAWHGLVLLWLGLLVLQARARPQVAAALEPFLAGVVLAVLAALAWWSGNSMLGGAFVGDMAGMVSRQRPTALLHVFEAASVVFAAAGFAWLLRQWPSLRHASWIAVAVVSTTLCFFLPSLGAVSFVLCVCAASRRWRLAGAAALSAAWIVGSFYYRLDWPLGIKALVLVAAGAMLDGLAWSALRRSPREAVRPRLATAPADWATRGGIALTLLAVLAVANLGIWQKERLIAQGEPVFVELAPVDPRSLMQGDYMRLEFRLPPAVETRSGSLTAGPRPHVVARRNARGVATLQRMHDGTPLAPGELLIELTPKSGRWILVTDAWFFEEGQAYRWEKAKYGEFRVRADGQALLVGLRDAEMKPL
jgi:uncharacterized membrane-anchored protein